MKPSSLRDFRIVLFASLITIAAAPSPNLTERVSVSDDEAQSNHISGRRSGPDLTADGIMVAFDSLASNLVPGDTNGVDDIFIRNRVTGTTERISVTSDGVQANGTSVHPKMSDNGLIVAFESDATNLCCNDTNGVTDVYIRDRSTVLTFRAVDGDRPSSLGSVSGNGAFLAFTTASTNLVTAVSFPNSTTILIGSHRSGGAHSLNTDDNGYFEVDSAKLSGGVNTAAWYGSFSGIKNKLGDMKIDYKGKNSRSVTQTISIWNWETSTWVELDSRTVGLEEVLIEDLTPTGSFSDFVSGSEGRGEVRVRILVTGKTPRLFTSGDLLRLFVSEKTTIFNDVYLHYILIGDTQRVSLSSEGEEANGNSGSPSLSADASYIAFSSFASNLVPGDTNGQPDIFVRGQFFGGNTKRVSVSSTGEEANGLSLGPDISADGRYVVFASDATNLVPDDTNGTRDVFVHDLATGITERVSLSNEGAQANGQSVGPGVRGGLVFGPVISADGRFVAFDSIATNLVAGDTNTCSPPGLPPYDVPGTCPDIFVRDRVAGTTQRFSIDSGGGQGNGASTDPGISANGLTVGFFSEASNLVVGDTNTCVLPAANFDDPGECPDIFAHDSP